MPQGSSIVITTGLWITMAFIIANYYKSNLMAMLIMPLINIPFDTLEELVSQNEMRWIFTEGGILAQSALVRSLVLIQSFLNSINFQLFFVNKNY